MSARVILGCFCYMSCSVLVRWLIWQAHAETAFETNYTYDVIVDCKPQLKTKGDKQTP